MEKKQKLELTWIGKDNQPKLEPRILIEDAEKSYGDKNSQNMLIYGDNLLALKALEQDFAGKVKCIFIDPPYNTGSAFTHYDDGIEHSLWLSLMRDRLVIIRRLLSAHGSLWITIDDNEAHYLKVLCDEVFGRRNFVANAIWQKKYTVANDAKWLSESHDHILIYAMNKEIWRPNRLERNTEMDNRYRNPDNHPKGPWKATPLYAKRTGSEKEQAFSFRFKNGVLWTTPRGTSPRFPADKLRMMDENDEIWFGVDGTATPSRKTFLSELKMSLPPASTIWLHSDVGNNHEAREEVKAVNPTDSFATPKPEKLLKRICELATDEGDLILDSFLGSGTTAAVAHKMGRRWIGIELGDHCDTHCLPRLRKVVDGTDQGGISKAVNWQGGGGFKYYYLAPSLLKKDKYGHWVIDERYKPEMLAAAMAKQEGFKYNPDDTHYWKQGRSTEKDYIFTTTNFITVEHIDKIHDEMQPDESLLICCKSFQKACDTRYPSITIKKIPKMLLGRCEFGRDDYSLNIVNMPVEQTTPAPSLTKEGSLKDDEHVERTDSSRKKSKKARTAKVPDLFGGDEEE